VRNGGTVPWLWLDPSSQWPFLGAGQRDRWVCALSARCCAPFCKSWTLPKRCICVILAKIRSWRGGRRRRGRQDSICGTEAAIQPFLSATSRWFWHLCAAPSRSSKSRGPPGVSGSWDAVDVKQTFGSPFARSQPLLFCSQASLSLVKLWFAALFNIPWLVLSVVILFVLLNTWLHMYKKQRREQELTGPEVIEEIIYGLESGILFGISSVISKMGFVMSEMGFPKLVVPAAISCSVCCSAIGFVYQVCVAFWRCFYLVCVIQCNLHRMYALCL